MYERRISILPQGLLRTPLFYALPASHTGARVSSMLTNSVFLPREGGPSRAVSVFVVRHMRFSFSLQLND